MISEDLRELTRFALVGASNVAVSFATFQILYSLMAPGRPLSGVFDVLPTAGGSVPIDAGVATAIGYFAGIVNSFLLNRAWTFRVRGHRSGQFGRFLMLNLAGLACSSVAMFVVVDVGGYPYLVTWIMVTGLVMIANFLGCKYWVFPRGALPRRGDATRL